LKKTILAVVVALCVSALAGAATFGQVRIQAPVAFTVGGTALPAGQYSIAQVTTAGVIQITNTATLSSVMVIGKPISSSTSLPSRATFTKSDGSYVLDQVSLPSGISYELPLHAGAR
jgi:hypothetical protein